jgi:hypothetical protein
MLQFNFRTLETAEERNSSTNLLLTIFSMNCITKDELEFILPPPMANA